MGQTNRDRTKRGPRPVSNVTEGTPGADFNPDATIQADAAERADWELPDTGVYGYVDTSSLQSVYGPYAALMPEDFDYSGVTSPEERERDTGMMNQGYELVHTTELDATNPDMAGQTYDAIPYPGNPEYTWVRYHDQPMRSDLGMDEPGEGGEGGEGGGSEFDIQAYMDAQYAMFEKMQANTFANTGKFMDLMRSESGETASYWDKKYQSSLAKLGMTPDDVLSGMYQGMGILREYMSGELPQDVQDQILRYRAEMGISRGSGSDMIKYGTARDLGINSLQLQQYGLSQYPAYAQQAIGMAQSFIPGTMNFGNIMSQNVGTMAPFTFASPGSMIGAISQGYQTQLGYDQLGFNYAQLEQNNQQFYAQMLYSQRINQQQLNMANYQMAMQQEAQDRAEAAAQRGQLFSLGTSIAGAATGGVMGLIGAGLGYGYSAYQNQYFGGSNVNYTGTGYYGTGQYRTTPNTSYYMASNPYS